MRTHNYSPRTIAAYVQWIKRFILFHDKTHPADMAGSRPRLRWAGREDDNLSPSLRDAPLRMRRGDGRRTGVRFFAHQAHLANDKPPLLAYIPAL